jgi:hypothetical protein
MSSVPIAPTPDDRFPVGFPRSPKLCAASADAFFTCLDKNTTKTSPSDTEATNRALKACLVSQLENIFRVSNNRTSITSSSDHYLPFSAALYYLLCIKAEKKVYEKCMIEYEIKNPPKRYRVRA